MSSSDSEDREKGTGSSSEEEEYWPYWKLAIIGLPQLGVMTLWIFLGPNFTPYLKSLGASDVFATLNNSAGPLVGFFTGPLVGALSDQSTSKWGRRRPLIVAGLLSTLVAGFFYSGAEQIMGKGDSAMYLAAAMQWVLDFTINVMQTPFRALIADLGNSEQQFPMQIFFSVICSIGGWFAFTIMGVYPVAIHHMLELMSIVIFVNIVCVALCLCVAREKVFVPSGKQKKGSACGFITDMCSACKGPGPKFRILLFVQAMVWLGNTVWGTYGKEFFTDCVFEGDSEAAMDSDSRNQYIAGAAAFGYAGQVGSFFNLGIALLILALALYTAIPRHIIFAPCILVGSIVCFLCAFVVGHDHNLATLSFVLSNVCLAAAGSIPYGLVAVWNKASEAEGNVGSVAMQMALLNCMITVGQQLCTMILAGFEGFFSLQDSIKGLFIIGVVSNGLGSVAALFMGEGKAVGDTIGSESEDNTSDAD